MYHHKRYTNNLIIYGLLFILGFVLGCNVGCGKTKCPAVKPIIINKPAEKTEIHVPTMVLEGGRLPQEVTKEKLKIRVDSFIQFDYAPVDTNNITQPYVTKYNELVTRYNSLQKDWDIKRDYQDTARFKAGRV